MPTTLGDILVAKIGDGHVFAGTCFNLSRITATGDLTENTLCFLPCLVRREYAMRADSDPPCSAVLPILNDI
tara:strand:- start:51378 stop:51593 length:216 start_codon:yes stop_codon:yes gene_type:complete